MTEVERLAHFIDSVRFEDLSDDVISQLKLRVLDSIGVAIGALDSEPIKRIREQVEEFGGNSLATLIGGGSSAPDRAAFYNGALVRYLDFMDSYLAPAETFHPSDNLGAVLAAAEYANTDGRTFLTALAAAYEVQARLSEAAPVRAKGFDHTTQGAYAAAAGASKALGLTAEKTANALAMSGTANNALRVTRTGALSHWKGLAYPNTAFSATHLTFLAMRGITGPMEVFEGNKGFQESIAGTFSVDWEHKSFEGVRRSIIKKFDAEIHSQSTIEAILALRSQHGFTGHDVSSVEVDIFRVAYDIIGGGEEGSKVKIRTKEEADHSLPYMIAVALLDGQLYPEQYSPARIAAHDVQDLLRKIRIKPDTEFSARFPHELPTRVRVTLHDGRYYEREQVDYEGFYTRPMSRNAILEKFRALAMKHSSQTMCDEIERTVDRIENVNIRDFMKLLSNLHSQQPKRREPMKTETSKRAFSFVPVNERPAKPRSKGMTEIRGPYYSAIGTHYLGDLFGMMGKYVDGLKFAGGSFALMPEDRVRELIELAHRHNVYVSTGGWIERVLGYGADMVLRYMTEAKNLGFDVLELSTGFISLPQDDLLRLIEKARKIGLKAKPELGIQFGAGGTTSAEELEAEGTKDVGWLTHLAKRCMDAGASIIMIESEGITESVTKWRTDAVARIINEVGLENVMFEAADPPVFEWYVKNYGIDVNLFVDHSQIVQLEALRSGLWGTKSTWGRIVNFPELEDASEKAPKSAA